MIVTRRAALEGLLAGAVLESAFPLVLRAGTPALLEATAVGATSREPWTADWDRALIEGSLRQQDKAYDPVEKMIASHRGSEYNYQSLLRNAVVHPIRDSFEYALVLLEAGGDERAQRASEIIERTLALQDSDPASKWFGLWSYYMEEPLPKMGAVDFNWADFNGSLLVLILKRHGARLAPSLIAKIHTGLRQACASIRMRDITPHYTNIIAQGSFVTLAAAEILADAKMLEYGLSRMRQWAAVVDECGSFTEYNSPGYTPFALENLLRIRAVVLNAEALEIAARLERRVWEELAQHWHAPTMQLAGPMSRAYSNDIGNALWLQKSLNNRYIFLTRNELANHGGALPAALLPYRCPEELLSLFLELRQPRQHREVFIPASILIDTIPSVPFTGNLLPVEGTTYLAPRFALGSCSRSDFWVQRRALLAFWGGSQRPPEWMQLRVLKDDYDFCSALFHSVQQNGMVLGAISFRTDGGDRHPLIERIHDGAFTFQKIIAEVQFGGWRPSNKILVNGSPAPGGSAALPLDARLSIDTGSCRIGIQFHGPVFTLAGEEAAPPKLEWVEENNQATLRLTLVDRRQLKPVNWRQIEEAFCGFTCWMSERAQSLAAFDAEFASARLATEDAGQSRALTWTAQGSAAAPSLAVKVLRTPRPFTETETGYTGLIDGKPMPVVRLSEERIAKS
jgi:hypothetical protein